MARKKRPSLQNLQSGSLDSKASGEFRKPSAWPEFLAPLLGRRTSQASKSINSINSDALGTAGTVSYEIDYDPIEVDPANYGMTAEELGRVTRISQEIYENHSADKISTIESLIEKYPQFPRLWNHLAVVYQSAGRDADAERVIEETYRRFPDYLFGISNYALLRLQQGHPEDVPRILKGTFALHELQNGRTHFHVSEVTNFFGMLAYYFLEIGELETAARYLDTLEEINPEHPMTETVRSKLILAMADIAFGE